VLPPYELKNKPFKTSLKGYHTGEVDEHIEFITNKYTELYRAYNDLERRFKEMNAEFDQLQKNEDAIRQALVNAQNAGARILREAGDRSQLILQSTKEKCKNILIDFEQQIRREQDTLHALKTQVADFKSRMFVLYQEHIELLESIAPEGEEDSGWKLAAEDYVSNVIAQVVLDVDASEKDNPNSGLTDSPMIEIDEETLESLMAAGRNGVKKSPENIRKLNQAAEESSESVTPSDPSDTRKMSLEAIQKAQAEQKHNRQGATNKEVTQEFNRPKV
jgi:cell division septum initiation protein DivIVA